ncbi:hypothetical protein [Chamaesiphon sp.]|uniref:hypothetical protein n=1 Tax=Chamaesiphon sp. TaxID=2814140 RepID=UPI00359381F5
MLNHFPLLTPSLPNSALAPHLWLQLVSPPLILAPTRTVREAISVMKGVRIVCDASNLSSMRLASSSNQLPDCV